MSCQYWIECHWNRWKKAQIDKDERKRRMHLEWNAKGHMTKLKFCPLRFDNIYVVCVQFIPQQQIHMHNGQNCQWNAWNSVHWTRMNSISVRAEMVADSPNSICDRKVAFDDVFCLRYFSGTIFEPENICAVNNIITNRGHNGMLRTSGRIQKEASLRR